MAIWKKNVWTEGMYETFSDLPHPLLGWPSSRVFQPNPIGVISMRDGKFVIHCYEPENARRDIWSSSCFLEMDLDSSLHEVMCNAEDLLRSMGWRHLPLPPKAGVAWTI